MTNETTAPRIIDAFTAPDGSRKKAFIPFVTCGDPSLEVTEELLLAMQGAGADLIELGIPFSDPTAEGPVIQQANLRALSAGTTTEYPVTILPKYIPDVTLYTDEYTIDHPMSHDTKGW